MKVTFWGVRGSIPAPLTPAQLRSKIASVVQRARPGDLANAWTRERFLAGLPPYLFGTIGGNTTCIEVRTSDDRLLILDCGSGLRELGSALERRREPSREFHAFLTHLHWDHIQGIPFFGPAWVKGNRIVFSSPMAGLERALRDQMREPFFPVTMDAMQAEIRFVRLSGNRVRIGATEILWKEMNHPGCSYAYKIVDKGKSLVFATDSEVTDQEFQRREENRSFFESADLLILDSQYTLEESFSKFDYGHTSYTMAVNLAAEWKVKALVLFHHEPRYEDRKIHAIQRRARWHGEQLGAAHLAVRAACEGMELEI